MKITRFVRMQLIIFAIVTVVAMLAMGLFYIRLPAMFGIGQKDVTLKLPTTGGLYQNANVSFRGVNVGKVRSVQLTPNGVEAHLSIDSGADIPAASTASVRSVSAIGEQFVDFTPTEDGPSGYLRDGSVVTSDQVPVEISRMLNQADALLDQVGDTRLRALMDEAFQAFNGTGEALQRLLDSMTLFVDEADKNVDATVNLIKQAGPLLETQSRTADDIRSWTSDVTKFTDQLRANRPELTSILAKGPGVASQSQQLFASMNQTLPLTIANLGVSARTMAVYLPNLRQIVVIYPRLMQALFTAINTGDPRYGANVNFSLGFQDPGTCTVGFMPRDKWRFGSAQEPRDVPPGMLCRVPQDSNLAVRGARNFPCVEFPGRRAPTPAECRTGYKPVSDNNTPFPEGLPFPSPWNKPVKPASATQPSGELTPGTPASHSAEPAVYATGYDPKSGDFIGPDGRTYNTGQGRDAQGQNRTWQTMITSTVRP